MKKKMIFWLIIIEIIENKKEYETLLYKNNEIKKDYTFMVRNEECWRIEVEIVKWRPKRKVCSNVWMWN